MKNQFLSKSFFLLILFLSVSFLSFGQYKGTESDAAKIYTVKEVKEKAVKLDRNDTEVTLRGFIVKKINSDTYIFKDATGTIRIEIDEDDMSNTPIDDKTEVIIIGEVDNDLFEDVEVEVDEIRIVSRIKSKR